MKKAIMMLAVLAVAGSVQAASIVWGTAWTYSTDYDAGTIAGAAWFVVLNGTSTTGISVDTTGALTLGTGDSTIGSVVSFGGSPQLSGTATVNGNTDNGKSYVVVAFDSATLQYGISQYYTLSGAAESPTPTITDVTFQNDNGYLYGNPSNGANGDNTPELYLNTPPTPVPEPASMALFGLGAGVLALRRRFQKKA